MKYLNPKSFILILAILGILSGCGTTKRLMKNCDKVDAAGGFWVCEKP